jgi:EKC/KEOPS complex subunit CGI121/TPRKB
MALLETLQLEHLPPNYNISIALYQNVKNSAFLHEQLLAGNTDFEYALIDASVVGLSLVTIFHAIHKPNEWSRCLDRAIWKKQNN